MRLEHMVCAASLVPVLLDRDNVVIYLLPAGVLATGNLPLVLPQSQRGGGRQHRSHAQTLTHTPARLRCSSSAASFAFMSWAQLLFQGFNQSCILSV